ncbi:MAG: sugar nucleotide-binding protein, partial [Acidobacteria bacterium]|nr:sugar nucleotide-binding protein [Acidobacteriota bacterium]NIQ86118.1 sugar nucleotide-binding protein [Acidobacteriota bacterium]
MRDAVVVLGGTGQLGQALRIELASGGERVLAPGREDLDLEETARIPERLESLRPRAVINAAAFNDVAGAGLERHRERAFR